jgi:hypothetical protein
MIRRRSLRFTFAAGLIFAGLSLSPEASSQPPPAPMDPAQPAPAQPPPSPYAPTMQAGGLAPPPPMDEKTAQTPSTPTEPLKTEQEEQEEKDEDSGRGLSWVWSNAEGGFQHVGLQTFNVDEENFTAGFIETTGTGGVVGVGLGVRLLFITIGARGRLGLLDAWQYFTVGGELGFRFPLGNLEPHFELGGGYAAIGSFSDSIINDTAADVSIRGFYARPSAGIDYFITPVLSIGASASWEFMAMTRPGLSVTSINAIRESPSFDDAQKARADVLSAEGSGYGSAVTFTGVIGLHL